MCITGIEDSTTSNVHSTTDTQYNIEVSVVNAGADPAFLNDSLPSTCMYSTCVIDRQQCINLKALSQSVCMSINCECLHEHFMSIVPGCEEPVQLASPWKSA